MLGRDKMLRETRNRLIGPGLGTPGPSGTHDDEIIEGRMSLAYMQGMLFPRAQRVTVDLGGDEAEDASEEDADDPLSMSNAMLPASIGMSLCIAPGSTVEVIAEAAVYRPAEPTNGVEDHSLALPEGTPNSNASEDSANERRVSKGRSRLPGRWQRRQLEASTKQVGTEGLEATLVLENHATLEVLSRTLANGEILLTVSLSNTHEAKNARSSVDTLYQVSICVKPVDGQIVKYPAARYIPPSDEERELRVIYGRDF